MDKKINASDRVEAWRRQSEIAQSVAAIELRALAQTPGVYLVMDEIVPPATRLRGVTVAEWAKRPDALVDEYAYWFDPEADACGLDPWRLVEGVDAHMCFDLFDVLFADGTYRTVEVRAGIYVKAEHYEVLQCALQSSRPGE